MTTALALAVAPSTRTRFCPSCSCGLPASSFLTTTERDDLGAFLRCRLCIRREHTARRFVAENRAAAKADPSGPLAEQVNAARYVAAHNVRAAALYAVRTPAHLLAVA